MKRRGRHQLICKDCREAFLGREGTLYCSDECVNRASNRRAKERLKAVKSDLNNLKKAYRKLNELLGDNLRTRVTKSKFEQILNFEFPCKRHILENNSEATRVGDIECTFNEEFEMYFLSKTACNEE